MVLRVLSSRACWILSPGPSISIRMRTPVTVYEPLMDDSLSYVRLVDAGRQVCSLRTFSLWTCIRLCAATQNPSVTPPLCLKVTMNNIKGYLPSKITQFLMCLHTGARDTLTLLFLARHA